MAAVDGKWDCTVSTPMGDQAFTLVVASRGDRFSGDASGDMGAKRIEDGQVDGDQLRWTMTVSKPMPLTLTCTAQVEGDAINGAVKAGIFGSFPVTGRRAA